MAGVGKCILILVLIVVLVSSNSVIFLKMNTAQGLQEQAGAAHGLCEPALGDDDSLMLSYPPDNNGINIEIWCKRTYFAVSGTMELQITRPNSIGGDSWPAGCFFGRALNNQTFVRDANGNLVNMTWVNVDLDHPWALVNGWIKSTINYTFFYDVKTDTITVVKYTPDGKKGFGPIPAPKDFGKLRDLVKDPPVKSCSLTLSNSDLGFKQAVGKLTVRVIDSKTMLPASHVDVQIKSENLGWALALPTNDSGIVQVSLASGNYTVNAVAKAFHTSISSPLISVDMTGDKNLNITTDTTILRSNVWISNGVLTSVDFNPNSTSMTLFANTSSTNSGVLFLTLPRTLLDDKIGNMDNPFTVLVDGKMTNFNETATNSTARSLVIPIAGGSEKIMIEGTSAIPEFNQMAPLVLLIAIISIITIYANISGQSSILKF